MDSLQFSKCCGAPITEDYDWPLEVAELWCTCCWQKVTPPSQPKPIGATIAPKRSTDALESCGGKDGGGVLKICPECNCEIKFNRCTCKESELL